MIKKNIFIEVNINLKLFIIFIFLIIIAFCILYVNYSSITTYNVFPYKKIVLDPGHGGIDGGASDKQHKLLEKDINLSISFEIKKFLVKKGIDIIMTRNKDISLENKSTIKSSRYLKDLNARKKIINESESTIFVSIHTNVNWRNLNDRGIIIFYYKNSFEGKLLAQYISDSVKNSIGQEITDKHFKNGKILPQNYYILRETNKPGVLIEVGYLSNPYDLSLLKSDEYHTRISEAISDGIINYLESKSTFY